MSRNLILTAVIAASSLTVGCAATTTTRPNSPNGSVTVKDNVTQAMARFNERSPNTRRYFAQAYGYAIFPKVGKGGAGIGGAYGRGAVFEQGRLVGESSLTQVTLGWQFGGQTYSQVIFFQDRAALERFKRGNLKMTARASAVAATEGASADLLYSKSIAVFTVTRGGLMYEASVGGQRYSYTSL